MKKSLFGFALVGTVSALGLAACGGGQQFDPDSPEAQAYIYRSSLMEVIAHEMATVNGMARGDIPANEEQFKKASSVLGLLSTNVADAFMQQATVPGSRALPEIWQNWDDFAMKAKTFSDAAATVDMAAQNGGIEAAKGAVQQLAQSCGGCHRNYRAPEDEE